VRAFVPPAAERARRKHLQSVSAAAATVKDRGCSTWVLVLDSETTTNADQQLRFGVYQLWNRGELKEAGIFLSRNLSENEIIILQRYAQEKDLKCMTADQFIDEVFYGCGYHL